MIQQSLITGDVAGVLALWRSIAARRDVLTGQLAQHSTTSKAWLTVQGEISGTGTEARDLLDVAGVREILEDAGELEHHDRWTCTWCLTGLGDGAEPVVCPNCWPDGIPAEILARSKFHRPKGE